MIYANNAGTSWPKPPEAREATRTALAASPHEHGALFEAARDAACAFLGIPGASAERFLFTPGCTSALAVALADLPWSAGDAVLTSSLEHHALVRPLEHLQRFRGVEHVVAPYRPGVPIDLDFVGQALARGGVRLVAVTAASNVTGELLPLAELSRLAHEHDALFLVDAAQTVGVVPVDVGEIGADVLTLAGHKGPLAPQGIGALWAAPHVVFESPLAACEIGGESSGELGGHDGPPCAPLPGYCDLGSVNMAAAAGLAAGLRWLTERGVPVTGSPALPLARKLAAALRERPFCHVYGSESAARTATLSLRLDGLALAEAEARFREHGIVVRAGQHCAPLALTAIGAPEGTLRISLGPFHGEDDVELLLAAVDALGPG